MAKTTMDYFVPGCPGGLAGLENLYVIDRLYANQARLDFDKTTGTYKIKTLPGRALLEMVVIENAEAFDGALKLGNAGDDEAYLADADFPKGVGLSDIYMTGKSISENTTVQLKVSGCSSGAGTVWIMWRPLL